MPPCADPARRAALEADDIAWLRWYFGPESNCPDPFTYDFTAQHLEIIEAIHRAIRYGGDQSIAASRGEGKTTLCERLVLKSLMSGVIPFAVICAATGTLAANILESIRDAIEENERLAEDYPEVCVPVAALENTPNRAHYQLASGARHDNGEPYEAHATRFQWCGQELVFPAVPGAPASQAILATRGLDAAVRGLKRKGRRPSLVVIDDPDTEDTARSEEQSKKLEDRIDRALGGLGGQRRNVARVMLTTLQSRICASYRYTDPSEKPTWKGKRFRFLVSPPSRVDLWDEYIQLRQQGMVDGDEFGRAAHQFYLDHREEMDRGAEVANPHRYNEDRLPDGSQSEVSALQHYYNEVARLGVEAVATEYDNDPPEESGPQESGITAARVQKQLSGYPRGVVPPQATTITRGVDIGKYALHWVVRAWTDDATGTTIDYGVQEVRGTAPNVDEGVEHAIRRALQEWLESQEDEPYTRPDGEIVRPAMTLIDARYKKRAIYAAAAEAGKGVYPAMGFGKSQGCVKRSFHAPSKSTPHRRVGHGWILSRQPEGLWLVEMDADHWKEWEHDRWMTSPQKPGALSLFGEHSSGKGRLTADEKQHHSYAHHICSEVVVEEVVRGQVQRGFKAKTQNNHWLDASYLSDVAASLCGISLLDARRNKQGKQAKQAKQRVRLSEIKAKKQGARQ